MKIVYLDAATMGQDIDFSVFEQFGTFEMYDRTPEEKIVEQAKGATVLLTNKCKLSKEILEQLPDLKLICVTATGVNIVDIEAAKALNITVTNVQNYGSMSVAQHVFALLLALTNRVAEHASPTRWKNSSDWCYYDYPLTELAGKTIGLIGYGGIGKKVAQLAEAFEMNVLINKRTPDSTDSRMVSLEILLKTSDVVSLHCPLTPENEQFINKKTLALMKPTAVLINTARGGLINEYDLAEALREGKLLAAALDVLSVEPPTADNPLLTAPYCLLTPHIAWATKEARIRLIQIVAQNIQCFLEGKPQNVVV